jgi:glycerol-3-phosphate dehydrogenase (NAD(P)+)
VIGAGSFGTAVAVLLARGGLRTTLQARTEEQAAALREYRENRVYLSGVEPRASSGSKRPKRASLERITCF